MASCLTSRAVSVKFHNCNDSVTRVAGRLLVPTIHSRDILHQAKGRSFWSSPLGSDGSRDDQLGDAFPGRAVAQRVSKLGLKGLLDYHSNETEVEAARQGASGLNKKGYFHEIFTQKRRAGKQL